MSDSKDTGTGSGGKTHFAPAPRATDETLTAAVTAARGHPVVEAILRVVGGVVLILNRQRQIVAVNEAMLDLLGMSDVQWALGRRPGEALKCIRAAAAPSGCGTGEACAECGAVIAIVTCQVTGAATERRCRLDTDGDGRSVSREFLVRAAPLRCAGFHFTVVTLRPLEASPRPEAKAQVAGA